jgi:sugar/nucleoside kinase (ribokinase family)
MLDVLAVGDICVDFVTPPLEDFSLGDRQMWIPALPMMPGGNAANFAFASAALGERTGLAACLGGDSISDFLRRRLHASGITSFVKVRSNAVAGRTIAISHADGTRQLITANGSNLAFSPFDIPAKALAARHVHRSGYWWTPQLQGRPTANLLRRARDRGSETSLDISTDPEGWPDRRRGGVLAALPSVTIFFGNEQEVRGLFGTKSLRTAAEEALGHGVDVLAVHRGAKGCTIAAKGDRFDIPAFRIAPRNPTGAGDVFNAGFVFGRLRGWDLRRCARFANAVAALHMERPERPYPSRAAVLRRFPSAQP